MQYSSSADNLGSEPDQIEYIVTFEKRVDQSLIEQQVQIETVQIAYSFSCVGRFYDVVKELCRRVGRAQH